jgi:hypothetical protein
LSSAQGPARAPISAASRAPISIASNWRSATARAERPGAVAKSVDDLHSDNNALAMNTSLTERGQIIPGVGFAPNRHDVLTGSTPEGRAFPAGEDRTCRNWTSSTQGAAMVGHIDRKGLRDDAPARSWNSSHPSRGPDGGCSQADLRSTGGDGLFYCFAAQ